MEKDCCRVLGICRVEAVSIFSGAWTFSKFRVGTAGEFFEDDKGPLEDTRPMFFFKRYVIQPWLCLTASTNPLLKALPPHAIEIAMSYLSEIVPKTPSRLWNSSGRSL